MSATGQELTREQVAPVLDEILARLYEGVEPQKLKVAGSIRRQVYPVHDIELLAIPKMVMVPDGLLLEKEVSALDLALDAWVADGRVEKAKGADRFKQYRHIESGAMIDLFVVRPPAQWGILYAIRTGPAGYSEWLVTQARRAGWHVRDATLHKGDKESCLGNCETVNCPDEQTFFEMIDAIWTPPENRVAPPGKGKGVKRWGPK
jgi:DNA polymerase/3'-5' exonuclease PolX